MLLLDCTFLLNFTPFNKTMIDYLFYLCVDILVWLAELTGTTYELINILIFVIGYPLFVILLLIIIYSQQKKIRKLENKFDL